MQHDHVRIERDFSSRVLVAVFVLAAEIKESPVRIGMFAIAINLDQNLGKQVFCRERCTTLGHYARARGFLVLSGRISVATAAVATSMSVRIGIQAVEQS